jgi:hypothetical protein
MMDSKELLQEARELIHKATKRVRNGKRIEGI